MLIKNVVGDAANRAISVIIAISAIGNSMSVLFSQGRINQELGREGVLPFSKFFGSNKPFNTPFAGLFLQWAVTLIILLAPPTGDIYGFLLSAFLFSALQFAAESRHRVRLDFIPAQYLQRSRLLRSNRHHSTSQALQLVVACDCDTTGHYLLLPR